MVIGISMPTKGQHDRQYGSRYTGVCHTTCHGKGHTRPGEILFGTDRTRAWRARSINSRPASATPTRALSSARETADQSAGNMRFYLEGACPGVMAKDVILHVIGDIGFDGATYRAMQWKDRAFPRSIWMIA
jgi:3-isopropylmalate/(R)-2-methylmalate dehydratase large subunit